MVKMRSRIEIEMVYRIESPGADRPRTSRRATRFAGGPDGPAGAAYRRCGKPRGEGNYG